MASDPTNNMLASLYKSSFPGSRMYIRAVSAARKPITSNTRHAKKHCNIFMIIRGLSRIRSFRNMFRLSFFIPGLLWVSGTSVSFSVDKFIKLALGASKAAYIPFDTVRSFTSGHIMEANGRGRYTRTCSVGGWYTKVYERHDTEVLLFKNSKQKLAVFAFRGTDRKISDALKNLKIRLTKVHFLSRRRRYISFRLHEGFKDRYKDISSWFEAEYQAIPREYTIVVTGHSLGGAMATVSAVYTSGKLGRHPDAVITFASPTVGDKKFQEYYNDVVGCYRSLRIKTRNDIGTSNLIFGYTHVCKALDIGRFTWNFQYNHDLYKGYERGLQSKYGRAMVPVNFGCDRVI